MKTIVLTLKGDENSRNPIAVFQMPDEFQQSARTNLALLDLVAEGFDGDVDFRNGTTCHWSDSDAYPGHLPTETHAELTERLDRVSDMHDELEAALATANRSAKESELSAELLRMSRDAWKSVAGAPKAARAVAETLDRQLDRVMKQARQIAELRAKVGGD